MKPTSASTAFVSVTTLFFAWGFITSNNDPLIAALKASFNLTYTEALMTQLISFAAYGFMSLPSAALLNRVGALRSILIALATMVCGCVLVQVLTRYQDYGLILFALFVLGIGVTMLQVAANPLAAALGPPESSHTRLTFAQGFNSLGVVLGVNFGSALMLGENVLKAGQRPISDMAQRELALVGVSKAFALIALFLVAMMVFIWTFRKYIESSDAPREVVSSPFVALRSRWAVFGAVAIGLYVGAEVSIGSIMINFLNQSEVLDISLEKAGFYLANVYWMGALAGRFIGSGLLTRIAAPRLLGLAAVIAALLCATVMLTNGPVAACAALAVGFFNSIMFPTIFTITLDRAGIARSATSGLLCVAIAGGAILPFAVGLIADRMTLSVSFIAPMIAYAAIAMFARFASNAHLHASGATPPRSF
ncbi:MAG: sugar MFS transporter [Hyphomonadaceae bacterium]|nr:MAG: major facilitator superfamily transporter [Caulobacteraceae bacterium]MBT9445675.1 sugar MFS transporter [Hyphomonadaceae bacterium]TPW08322.1 MAG: major facilitator superfamily transporter [Alphaproteobacteria bacterium]